jgi:hypothetical protein
MSNITTVLQRAGLESRGTVQPGPPPRVPGPGQVKNASRACTHALRGARLEGGVAAAPDQAAGRHAGGVQAARAKQQLHLRSPRSPRTPPFWRPRSSRAPRPPRRGVRGRRWAGGRRQRAPVGRQDVEQRAALLRLLGRAGVEHDAVAALQRGLRRGARMALQHRRVRRCGRAACQSQPRPEPASIRRLSKPLAT